LLGGTFDPVHNAHLGMAKAAVEHARLDRVLMVPCAQPPHKTSPDLTDGYHRFAMLALAVGSEPTLAVSPLELRRGGISFTVETLRRLSGDEPDRGLFLIVGSDSFAEMDTWREMPEILSLAGLVIVPRPGWGRREIEEQASPALRKILLPAGAACPEPAGQGRPFGLLVDMKAVEVSSTGIRNSVREGRAISGLVPAPVETYIRRQGLYEASAHA
jgi:nicotinate-nucleotide adenylyltransferase